MRYTHKACNNLVTQKERNIERYISWVSGVTKTRTIRNIEEADEENRK